MKCDQIAFYAATQQQSDAIKAHFGLTHAEWVQDTVTARSIVNGVDGINKAELQFNYSLGIELEILRYIEGMSWHHANPLASSAFTRGLLKAPFISHVGIHLDDGEPFPEMAGCRLVQETFTLEHTGKYLTDPASPGFGRKYHYRIFELSPGSYIKYIARIHPKKEG